MKKFIKNFKLVIIALLVIILFIFLINNKNSIIEKAPIRILVIKSNSMYPKLKINDIIIIKKSNNYNVKDIITYSTDNEVLITHRIVKSCEGGFITKGDNNNSEDNELVKLENIKGKVILRINRNYQILMVLLFIVLVFFVFFNTIRRLKIMNLKNKLMVIILIILVMISSCSVVFGRYILESEKTELANINIKTCDFTINDLSKYGTFDLYLDGQKVSSSISSFNRKLTIGTTYEIKNIKINSGYVLETDSNSLKGAVSNTTTINLSFSTISYTISYSLNGGSITGENKNYTVETDSFTLPTPIRNGYTFTGWTGTGLSTATKTVTISKGSTGNKSYTANWTPTNYTISYNTNGGSITGQKTSYNIETDSFTLPTPTRNGYTFTGWTGTGLSSATKTVTISKGNTGNKSYTANWTPINYTISYNANGGAISGQKTSYNIETASFNLLTPTKNGYTFTGWTGTGLSTATKTVTISKGSTGNKSYTANWTPTNYTISYNTNGGSITGQKTSYNIETASFNLVTPTRNGYTFSGWTGTGLSSATNTVTISKGSTGNRSYTANWTPINYTISYNANGGSISGQRTSYNIETASFNLVTPSRTGYTFTGWTGTGLSGATKTVTVSKGSTGNRSYTANWVDDIKPTIHGAWITSGPTYEVRSTGYGYRVNIQVSCSDSGSGINRVLTYYDLNGGWAGETNITGSMTDSFWFKPGYRQIKIVVYDNAGNSSETIIGVQCG